MDPFLFRVGRRPKSLDPKIMGSWTHFYKNGSEGISDDPIQSDESDTLWSCAPGGRYRRYPIPRHFAAASMNSQAEAAPRAAPAARRFFLLALGRRPRVLVFFLFFCPALFLFFLFSTLFSLFFLWLFFLRLFFFSGFCFSGFFIYLFGA